LGGNKPAPGIVHVAAALRLWTPPGLLDWLVMECQQDGLDQEWPEPFVLDTPFWIEMDSTRLQTDGSLLLQFIDVPEDSRCPVGADIQCVWAGTAIGGMSITPLPGANGDD
jgi:hypothetical protein